METALVPTSIKQVEELAEIGRTYEFNGVKVVPSQAYAQFCGKKTKHVNEALKRVSKSGRLAAGLDFFILKSEMEIQEPATRSQLATFKTNHGLTLLTQLAVNTLSHYFDDAASVAHSKRVNAVATKSMSPGSLEELLGDDEEGDRELFMISDLALRMAKQRKINRRLADELRQVREIAEQPDAVLTSSQVSELDALIGQKYREFDFNGKVCGLIKRRLKAEFFAQTSSRTYKELPRGGFAKAKEIIINWQPTEIEKRSLLPKEFA